ncbi:MAG: hypothetical protein LBK27_08715 [Treponema sp.]|jgi:hypothetical protein|nr:hypothetical protein [Treponema sp.]
MNNNFLHGVRKRLKTEVFSRSLVGCFPGFAVPCLAALLLCFAGSCSTGEAAGQILGMSSAGPPVLLEYKVPGPAEIEFRFSLPVKVLSLNLSPDPGVASVEEGAEVRVHLVEAGPGGERITADLLVEDEAGNTLNVLVPLRTRNTRLPPLLITEMRTEVRKPQGEYVEFKTLAAGNLGALRLFIASNPKNPLIYEFPPVEVAAGEYILIHLRNYEAETADETGTNLNLSGGTDAVAGVRDFWAAGTEERFRKTDMVYFLDQDDRVIDAVVFSETAGSWWNKGALAETAEFLFTQGAFTSPGGGVCGPTEAVQDTIKSAMTSSIARDETMADSNTAADWFIAPANQHTPGKKNNPRP